MFLLIKSNTPGFAVVLMRVKMFSTTDGTFFLFVWVLSGFVYVNTVRQ